MSLHNSKHHSIKTQQILSTPYSSSKNSFAFFQEQREVGYEFCSKHPMKQAPYYLSQQPELKFCSKCALNYALCGKQIQRVLSSQELEKKIDLDQILKQIKIHIAQTDSQQKKLESKAHQIEANYILHIQKILKYFDTVISNWSHQRNEIHKLYTTQISNQFNRIQEIRTKTKLISLELKQSLQDIENNTGLIIHELDYQNFNSSMKTYKDNIGSILGKIKIQEGEDLYNTVYMEDVFGKIKDQVMQFKRRQQESLLKIGNEFETNRLLLQIDSNSLQTRIETRPNLNQINNIKETLMTESNGIPKLRLKSVGGRTATTPNTTVTTTIANQPKLVIKSKRKESKLSFQNQNGLKSRKQSYTRLSTTIATDPTNHNYKFL